ncbi:hypothetical protein [Pseudoflavonifractor phocaeensis]|uniref:hypothetical protein n=1 Tax=Pseudoflavonifractor phocaeensis TaxID=1870988 RepID=UPI001F3FB02D|nr:hypothetical protein [Pseudoflavonifractor phocaeensis]MCF2661145.1 hypothetical protein [Pseudoflavonifractor phocaeensis]
MKALWFSRWMMQRLLDAKFKVTGMRMYNLTIDPEFKQLIPPLMQVERQQLEENIKRDGCREPIALWGNTIIDGHNRYEICRKHNLPFNTVQVELQSREEAIAWICANQLGKRNISDESRRYLIGKRYAMEKILGAHNSAGINQYTKNEAGAKLLPEAKSSDPEIGAKLLPEPQYDRTATRTRERLGREYHISHATVLKYSTYSEALDYLAEIVPELISKVLSGQVKISQENILELAKMPPLEIKRLGSQLVRKKEDFVGYSNARRVIPTKPEQPTRPLYTPNVSIKNMPEYDPDAEFSSLTLTIPSWVSSIMRTQSIANLEKVTPQAKSKLVQGLMDLRKTVDELLSVIEEVE